MIQTIRNSKVTKVVASYLAIQLIIQMIQPAQLWALTSGPTQPEFNSFTPIGTSDMVNVSSGDFNYNIPIMDVGGYPLNLAYDSGITMDQEASWVGLGWNLNVGQIVRDVRGLPDDFDGDQMLYENDMKRNVTVGVGFNFTTGVAGLESGPSVGISAQYNNYEGISFRPTVGISFQLNDQVGVGADLSASVADGATISPRISITKKYEAGALADNYLTGSLGVNINSRKGLESLSLSTSVQRVQRSISMVNGLPFVSSQRSLGTSSQVGVLSFNNNTFTPTKRAGIEHSNFSFAASLGGTAFLADSQLQVNGFGSYQDILPEDKYKEVPAFGYEHTEKAEGRDGVLDFNREKDRSFNKHTTVVPVTNYTHDTYSIQGQGINGMFRPHRSQVSYVRDQKVTDEGEGGSLGVKLGFGWNFYVGGKIERSISNAETGRWTTNNNALGKFIETTTDKNPIDYEPSYFKMVGEQRVDLEDSLFVKQLSGTAPMKLAIEGNYWDRKTSSVYQVKKERDNGEFFYEDKDITVPSFKRTQRDQRNQSIIKVTQEEAANDPLITSRNNNDAIKHHTAGMKILKPDGSTYVYGETAYNHKKVEATFDVSGRTDADCIDGTIGFTNPGQDKTDFSDQYLNRITTPAYAHTYLLKSVLSSDYEDIGADGPTPDDLGAYTLFTYDTADTDYKWRIPYDHNKASYNEGLKSNENDQKGNYLYGEKELKYISKIETKTHVAIFHLSDRMDARGAKGELPGSSGSEGYMKKIDKISLYSKPEYDAAGESASPIKEAYFKYSYKLCKGIPNNLSGEGKLTLDKLYFTYRNSNMGKYTPYVFNYDGFNPEYNLKSYDIWGHYKPVVKEMISYDTDGNPEFEINEGITIPKLNVDFDPNTDYCVIESSLTAPEFPFVQQQHKKLQDAFASAWTMTSIELPSGGTLEMQYESDDYQYVQDHKAMQMFMVTGASSGTPDIDHVNKNELYDPNNKNDHIEYIYVKLSDQVLNIDKETFEENYLGDQINEPIQFRFLLNMVAGNRHQSDYVSGYFEIDRNLNIKVLSEENKGTYAAIPLKKLERGKSNKKVNPISKAGWYFGRTYLNKQVYSIGGNSTTDDFEEILEDLAGSISELASVFTGPNAKLQEKNCAMKFEPNKSWVRLLHPNLHKLGGGVRVKEIRMQDNWDAMLGSNDTRYLQFYGQQYSYTNEEGDSYGVASFEPNGSKENPFVTPFYDRKAENTLLRNDQLTAPQESNYAEKPFGESFFPASTVTYSRVETRNLPRTRTEPNNGTYVVKKGATGKVVNEMYTTKDFPTIVDYTGITNEYDPSFGSVNFLATAVGLPVIDKNHLTLSQGFSVVTNDMNGKVRKQQVFAEDQQTPISEVEYKYSVDEKGRLNNTLPVIDAQGKVHTDKAIAVHYDMVNEFRENNSSLKVLGLNTNLSGFLILFGAVIAPVPLPIYADHEQILRTATTTKVIHKSAVLVEKIAKDVGSEVSTKNLAWDAVTGEVLLTETVNEYGNHYYNMNYPSHWYYEGMGPASKNVGITGTLTSTENLPQHQLVEDLEGKTLKDYFYSGDELMTIDEVTNIKEKLWVIHVADDYLTLMNARGFVINQECSIYTKGNLDFKIVRSGFRNQQMSSMASVTSMINPIDINNDGVLNDFSTANFSYGTGNTDPRIVNASAVSYTDYWKPQRELDIPGFPSLLNELYDQILNEQTDSEGNPLTDQEYITTHKYGFNPYLYNVRGDWRAVKSYAYLGGRNSNVEDDINFSTGAEGYFTSFNSFYNNSTQGDWSKQKDNWTFASQVNTYSPYGAELENKDALNRYSAAQYGYQYTLPTAVGSNTQYREMGYDGFEDYTESSTPPINTGAATARDVSHFDFQSVLGGNGLATVERTNEYSHTGRYSMAIPGGSGEVMQNILLNDCETTVRTIRCQDDNGSAEEPNSSCNVRRVRVFLAGDPNEEIGYNYNFNIINLETQECVSSRFLTVDGTQYSNNSGTGAITLDENGTAEFIVSGGATGFFGLNAASNVQWEVNFDASATAAAVDVVLQDLCDDRGDCNTLGDPVGGNN